VKPSRVDIGEEYLAQVAHELRGSLNAILGWAEFLRTSAGEDPARKRAAETIIRHARQQTSMVGELIDTWRLAAGTLVLTFSPLDPASLVAAAIEVVRPIADAKTTKIELVDRMPHGLRVRADPKRLGQTVLTLLSNAVHFAPADTKILVTIEGDAESVRLRVHDEGAGVSTAAMPFLFNRNQQIDRGSARATFRLGLAFAHDVVERHGGSLHATNEPQGGLTYHLELPVGIARLESFSSEPRPAPRIIATGAHPLGGLRVLLVDDEPDAREALIGILQNHGAHVEAAGSAADAITALQRHSFDVLLADIGMPGADGYDLIRYIRALESGSASHVPAAAVTAFASDADRRKALEAGFQVHLAKPVDPAALVETVVMLGRH
jgi:CheY-like chemotaxis protein